MSNISVNTITDASGGSTASINGLTPQASNMQPFNRIINGAMTIDQRNAGAAVSTPANYALDRWKLRYSAGTCTVQRSTTSPAGFNNSFQLTVGTARTVVSGDRFGIEQPIEGFNSADFGWGTANAQPVTLSFWVRSSLTGTFGLCFTNFSRGYAATYIISAANTWEYKTVTIVGDTSGTWDTTSGTGVLVVFDIGMGSDVRTTTGSWQAGTFLGATGATDLVSTSGATFYITGVQLEAGSSGSSFAHENYSDTLQKCQRYYYKEPSPFTHVALLDGSGNYPTAFVTHPVEMRATPATVFESLSSFYYNSGSAQINFIPAGGTTAYSGNARLGKSQKSAISNSAGATQAQKCGQWEVQLSFSAEL